MFHITCTKQVLLNKIIHEFEDRKRIIFVFLVISNETQRSAFTLASLFNSKVFIVEKARTIVMLPNYSFIALMSVRKSNIYI